MTQTDLLGRTATKKDRELFPWLFQPKYERWMAVRMIELMEKGATNDEVAADLKIGRSSFYNWKNSTHKYHEPEFSLAYEYAQTLRRANYWKEGRKGWKTSEFNSIAWIAYGRNVLKLSEHRIIELPNFGKASSYAEKFQIILEEVAKGKVTPQEALLLTNTISAGARTEETTDLKQRLEQLEKNVSN